MANQGYKPTPTGDYSVEVDPVRAAMADTTNIGGTAVATMADISLRRGALSSVTKVVGSPIFGGALTVGANEISGANSGKSTLEANVGRALDGIAGTGIGLAATGTGVALGVAASPFVTPAGGAVVGVGASAGINYGGAVTWSVFRQPAIDATVGLINVFYVPDNVKK
ncbi:hypothetical protein [Massilia scottii]|uniref:hypothetical protein n=1 Tax=Massilia scottii TaxID=3057166 RepID=UPI00279659FE|nr:hypothetical protein [Massilia sp. CCM 9029]MDQ1834003.1 hypothetical protein [Massilia sp. CCM 9029]